MIKAWVDKTAKRKNKIYDLAVSGDRKQGAFYYVRVVQNPTPSQLAYEMRVFGFKLYELADPIRFTTPFYIPTRLRGI
ncbi:MAG: DUF3604 domain-containing protein [Gammaproteobacteria bacterium]